MTLLVCVDDHYGLGFNHRRQSSDRKVIEEIVKISAGKRLWVDSYSVSLFPEEVFLCADKDYLTLADAEDCCFSECADLTEDLHKFNKIILFRWNKSYPSDIKFPYDSLLKSWKPHSTKEFAGNSHESITMEVYVR